MKRCIWWSVGLWTLACLTLPFAAPSLRSDAEFKPGNGADAPVRTLLVQQDGKILCGGSFTNFNGVHSPGLVRLLPNGELDPSFNVGAGANAVNPPEYSVRDVTTILALDGGQILVGGNFTLFADKLRLRLARLNADGSLDDSFQPQLTDYSEPTEISTNAFYSPSIVAKALALQADGKILVGGGFSKVNDTYLYDLARLNADGSLDPSFAVDGPMYSQDVRCILPNPDGKILIGGKLGRQTATDDPQYYLPRVGLARLLPDGRLDKSFDANLPFGTAVNAFHVRDDGTLLLGVSWSANWGDWPAPKSKARVYRFDPNGSGDRELLGETDGEILYLAAEPDESVLLAGSFEVFGGWNRQGLARLLPDGRLDYCFETGLGFRLRFGASAPAVYTVGISHAGGSLIGGNFMQALGQARNGLAALTPAAPCPPGQIQFARTDYRYSEDCGSALITLVRSTSNNDPVTVEFSTEDGTASAGLDYTPTILVVTFAPGERSKTIPVPVAFDLLEEETETIRLTSSHPTGGATLGPLQTATLFLENASPLPATAVPDPDFAPFEMVGGYLGVLAVKPDGRLIVRQSLYVTNFPYVKQSLVQLELNGVRDPSFAANLEWDGPISTALPRQDGTLLVAGTFTNVGGIAQRGLVRITPMEPSIPISGHSLTRS